MTKSKFKLWALLPLALTLLCSGILYVIISKVISSSSPLPTAVYVFTSIFVFTWVWLVFGELRTKTNAVSIDNDFISSNNFLGLGIKQKVNLKDVDGFITCIEHSRYNDYEALYVIKDHKRIIKFSEFYYKNYSELKQVLSTKIKFIGEKSF